MGAKDALLKKLRGAKSGLPGADPWEQKKDEWVADLDALMATIASWLSDARDEGLLAIDKKQIELREEDLGPYDVPSLEIQTRTVHPRTVHVMPRGMRVVGVVSSGAGRIGGASGRVDLTSGASRTILLRRKSKSATSWQVALPDGHTAALDEEAFFKAFKELIE